MNADGKHAPLSGEALSAVSGGKAAEYDYYRPTARDTLESIARKFGTTVEALLQFNPFIDDPRVLYTNWQLKVPAMTRRKSR